MSQQFGHLTQYLLHELHMKAAQMTVIVGGVITGITLKDFNLWLSSIALVVSIVWGIVQITLALIRYRKEQKDA